MPKAIVYYFSGTGNSLYLAQALSSRLEAKIIPIASVSSLPSVEPDADIIIIVYPVYYNDLPVLVKEFAGKLRSLPGHYVVAVCNYGGCGSQSVKTLGAVLSAAGGELSAAYGIHMPQNAFVKFWENNNRLLEKADRKAAKIAADVTRRSTGNHLKGLLNAVFVGLHESLIPSIKKDLSKRTGLPSETELDVLIRSNDSSFSSNGCCTGCGTCAKVCPVGNIELQNRKPVWLHRCENCLACRNWCPVTAIEGGVASKGYYYVNPKLTAADIAPRRSPCQT